MNLVNNTKIILPNNFKKFRLTGIWFETRNVTYVSPNRTLSSYILGKNKKTLDFW